MNYLKKVLFLTAMLASLGACDAPTPSNPTAVASTNTSPKMAAAAITSPLVQRKNATSPLRNLLSVFASHDPVSWSSFDHVPGVRWRDAKPLDNPNSNSSDTTNYRSGNLLLIGFDMVDVPDGQTGADASTKKDNEGNVGVTLNGNGTTVRSAALLKFYPSDNYTQIIQHQLDSADAVTPIADHCALDYGTTAANTRKNAFYQIKLGAASVYVEGGRHESLRCQSMRPPWLAVFGVIADQGADPSVRRGPRTGRSTSRGIARRQWPSTHAHV